MRAIAIRRCTRHVSHWQQGLLADLGAGDLDEPIEFTHGMDDNGSLELEEELIDNVDIEELPADKRPPEHWIIGEDPATPRQLAVLRDHDICVPEGCTRRRPAR